MIENNRRRRDLILHPVRLRLLTELTGRAMTSRQLAACVPDVSQATLYRHIGLLADAGIFEVVSERKVRGVVERTYSVAQGRSRLGSEDLREMTAEEHQQAFAIFQATLAERFAEYARAADLAKIEEQGMSYNATALYLTDAERQTLAARFRDALEGFEKAGPGRGRQRFTLASVVIPETPTEDTASRATPDQEDP